MYLYQQDIVMRREQYQDLLRQAKLERLIRVARPRPAASVRLHRKAARWLGARLVSWGQNLLQTQETPAHSEQLAG